MLHPLPKPTSSKLQIGSLLVLLDLPTRHGVTFNKLLGACWYFWICLPVASGTHSLLIPVANMRTMYLIHGVVVHPGRDVVEHGHGQLAEQADGLRSRVAVGGQVLKVVIDADLCVDWDAQVPEQDGVHMCVCTHAHVRACTYA